VRVSASLGVVFSSKRGESSEDILRQADVAMYAAKARGRDCFSVFEPSLHSAAFARLDQRAELQRALDENQFNVYYQPIVELESGRIVGMEALLRWIHPDRGVVPPNEFVPLAEDSGLIVPIGRWVLRTACQQASAWRRDDGALGRDCYVSVNVASKQLQQAAFVDEVRCALEESGLPAGALMLEVTESSLVDDTDDGNIDRLRRLHELGARLAIDDFGTGYSAFNYLRRFPMDVIKIDRSWVRGVAGGSQDAALVEGIISMAASLDLAVVAEGIEEDEQLAALRALDCAAGQGYLFAKPADAETATELLRRPGGAARRAA
jgi:EAL domain-containing protein (putative c-di-GMP-specific phosphodiesterase class I)